MAYIDVRGVYPSFVSGQFSISLEEYIKTRHIPDRFCRDLDMEDIINWLIYKGICIDVEPEPNFDKGPEDTFENLAESFGFTPDEFRNIGK